MNCKNWLHIFFSIVLFTLIINFSLHGQSYYIEKYPGIPVIAHTNVSSSSLDTSQLQKMKDLGILGFYATDLTDLSFQTITANNLGLKVFPYQIWSDSAFVVYYTDAMYTKWEAEGKGYGTDGDVELKHTSLGESFTEVDTSGIVTNSNSPGVLMYGPAYYQEIRYKQIPLDYDTSKAIVKYTANYRLKISQQEGIQLPQNYVNDTVCVLQIVATNPQYDTSSENYSTVLFAKGIKVSDFIISGSGWNNWTTKSFVNYSLDSLKTLTQAELNNAPSMGDGSLAALTNQFDSRWMQYKVIWKGLNYIKLYVDYIEISDLKGRRLKTDSLVRDGIVIYLNRYPAWNDTTYSLGWFGLNEPRTIDNFEPFRLMESIIHSNNPNLHLYTTFTTGWMGIYGAPWPGHVPNGDEYKGTEFIKRSKLPYISYNNYIFNWPYYPSETNAYYLENINEILTKNLAKLKTAGIPISYSTQSGKFFFYDDSCHETVTSSNCHVPSNAQMNYHINLGLLFGMKELTCDPFFTLNRESNETCAGKPYRIGLVNFYDNTLTPLGQFWKDTIKPRMSGTLGKTIKGLTPMLQFPNQDANLLPSIKYEFVNKVGAYNNTLQKLCVLDLGFFSGGGIKYFMAVNRYYSEWKELRFSFQELTYYKNWEVTNFVTNKKRTVVADINNAATYIDTIPVGDAGLYSVLPVVKYGGTLISSEAISGTNDLSALMTIASGATLTVSGTYNIYGNITVNSGGNIVLSQGAQLNFFNGTSLIVNGTLTANGISTNKITFDFTAPNLTVQNSIKVYQGGSISISHSIIKNGCWGIYINRAAAAITNSEVTSCTQGIVITGTDYITNQPVITNCKIHSIVNGFGLIIDCSSPLLIGNELCDNFTGAFLSSFTQADFGNLGNYGNNYIHNNSGRGIYASYYSAPFLGRDACEIQGGRNILENNSIHNLYITSYVPVIAENNWWGSNPPDTSKIYSPYHTIDYDPWLTSSPLQQYATLQLSPEDNLFNTKFSKKGLNLVDISAQTIPAALDSTLPLINKLGYAKRQIDLKHYKTAQQVAKEIIEKYPDSSAAFLALGILWRASKENDIESFKKFLNNLGMQKTKNELSGAAEIIDAGFEKNNRADKLNKIITKYKDTKTAEFGYFNLFMYYFFEEGNKAKAKETGDLITSSFPNSPAAMLISELVRNQKTMAKKAASSEAGTANSSLPIEYELLGNYPNPFNPSTTISYALPLESNVEINIFDIMGRLVRAFELNGQSAGYQNVLWNGKNENNEQVASGIYLYRFKAVATDGKVFEKTSKLLMLK